MAAKLGSVAKMAKMFQVSTDTVVRWAHGRAAPSALARKTIEGYFEAFGLQSPDWKM